MKYVYENDCYHLFSQDMMLGLVKRHITDYDKELVRMSTVNEALQHILTDLNYIRQDELDADEGIINFQSGLLRITEDGMLLQPHSPDMYSTVQIPCNWVGKEEPTPAFDAYLDTLTDGDTDIQQHY